MSIQGRLRIGFFAAALLIMVTMATSSTPAAHGYYFYDGSAYGMPVVDPQEVIIKTDHTGGTIRKINNDYGTTTLEVISKRLGSQHESIYRLETLSGDAVQLAALMTEDPRIIWAVPSTFVYSPEGAPERRYEWATLGVGPYRDQYGLAQIGMAALDGSHVHDLTRGAGSTVAIIDTGFEDHPEIPVSPVSEYDYLDPNSQISDLGDGIDNDGDGDFDETIGHGTFVAGVVSLVAPDANLLTYRILDSDGSGLEVHLVEAIDRAVTDGANVINLSLEMPGESWLLEETIQQATAAGVLIIAAAGNDMGDMQIFPAADPCVLGVSAIGPSKQKLDFANWGSGVNVVAPGDDVYSTFVNADGGATPPEGEYAYWSGTSMATPWVSGLAALIRDINPALTPHEVASLIANMADSVDGLNPGYEGSLGSGLIDVYKSVAYVNGNPNPTIAPSALLGCAP